MPNHLRRLVQGERAVIQTRDGKTLRGLVEKVARDCVLLIAPEELIEGDNGQPTIIPLEGCVVVERGNVSYTQLLGGTA